MSKGDRLFLYVKCPVEDPKRTYYYAQIIDRADSQGVLESCPHRHQRQSAAIRCGERMLRRYPCHCRRMYDRASVVFYAGADDCPFHGKKDAT